MTKRLENVHDVVHELQKIESRSPRYRTYGDTIAMTKNTEILIKNSENDRSNFRTFRENQDRMNNLLSRKISSLSAEHKDIEEKLDIIEKNIEYIMQQIKDNK